MFALFIHVLLIPCLFFRCSQRFKCIACSLVNVLFLSYWFLSLVKTPSEYWHCLSRLTAERFQRRSHTSVKKILKARIYVLMTSSKVMFRESWKLETQWVSTWVAKIHLNSTSTRAVVGQMIVCVHFKGVKFDATRTWCRRVRWQ